MADGFLGRWSQRKQQVREGRPLEEPVQPAPQPSPASGRGGQSAPLGQALPCDGQQVLQQEDSLVSPPPPLAGEGRGEGAANVPAPTLEDVQALTPQSDFKPFMARDVDPEVKNAAMKKLFTDPHYNVMDRLDIYIDDYSQPDPLPQSMLRQMVSAKFLNLFDDEKTKPVEHAARDNAGPTPVAEAASPPQDPRDRPADAREPVPTASPQTTSQDHAHTDLRLQQDHAPGPEGPGRGAG